MAQTLINIKGDVRDAASLTVPADRTFRGAWTFNGNAIEIDPVKQREIFRRLVTEERDRRMAALAAGYTASERETWPVQVEEAKAVLADPNAPTPLLTALAAVRGQDVPTLANHVLTLAAQFSAGTGAIMAKARALAEVDLIPDDYTDDSYWVDA
jgi:hypothetical protein